MTFYDFLEEVPKDEKFSALKHTNRDKIISPLSKTFHYYALDVWGTTYDQH